VALLRGCRLRGSLIQAAQQSGQALRAWANMHSNELREQTTNAFTASYQLPNCRTGKLVAAQFALTPSCKNGSAESTTAQVWARRKTAFEASNGAKK